MSEAQIFEYVTAKIIAWCEEGELPIPNIIPNLPTDPCDYTELGLVRLNVKAFGGNNLDYYAAHVFGHYICDAHCESNDSNNNVGDDVADFIAKLLLSRG